MGNPPRGILLTSDGAEEADLAARAAADFAARSGSELHVFHVLHDVHTTHLHGYVKRELHRWGREILDEQVKKLEEKGATVADSHLKLGNTVEKNPILAGSRHLGGVHYVDTVRELARAGREATGRNSALAREEVVAHEELTAEGDPADVIVGSVSLEVLRRANRHLVGRRRLPDDRPLSRRFRLAAKQEYRDSPEKTGR